MCGIVGYIGDKEAEDLLLTGLKRLEYRGYDSAGLATVNGDVLHVQKQEGKVDDLRNSLNGSPVDGTTGVGHTRWATHGAPNDANAHPHASTDGSFALVHNGIIENHGVIKERLEEKGYTFQSETDTEVLVYLIEEVQRETDLSLPEAVRQALTQIVGAYGIALVSREDPDLLIAARNGSPLILGVGDG
ncbi:MAG: glutamine--fructose-6-phosphate aminotransferase, partial [Bacteroidetes bacterium QS_4_64_154]